MPIRVLKDQKKKCTQEIKKTRHEAEAKAACDLHLGLTSCDDVRAARDGCSVRGNMI